MSRLPPAMRIAPLGGRQNVQAQSSKQQQAFELDTGHAPQNVHFIARESVDATLQGGNLEAGMVVGWHPKYPILAVATNTAVVEYDAISGCRRNYVESSGTPIKLRYTPDGSNLILLTKERNITSWSTATWKRRSLLVAEARYANRPLVSGLLAISAGKAPTVFYSPMGKHTLRTIHLAAAPPTAKGAKPDKERLPGFKLKTENKKPIVGLAAHPSDPSTVFLLLVDGSLLVCGIGEGTMVPICGVPVPFDASRERVQVHAVPHPTRPGQALVMVEAERSGLTLLSVPARNEARILSTLRFGAGGALCGVGLVHKSCVLVAAVRHAGGNVGLQAWRLLADSRDLSILPLSTAPGTVWDALQGGDASETASSLADVSGEAVLAGMALHGPSGLAAFWTTRQDESGAAHLRVPMLLATDGEDVLEGLSAAKCLPVHTAPSFWTAASGGDGVVSKLHFPRYTHLINSGRVSSYDFSHGLMADFLVPPPLSTSGQERSLVRALSSSKQGLWLAFMRTLSTREGALLSPGQYEFTAVSDNEASVAAGQWWLPGRDGVFVGGRDELTVVLSNSGTLVAVFDTPKLAKPSARALYVAELKEGAATRLFPGPPTHIPAVPEPRPEEPTIEEGEDTDDEAEAVMRQWEEGEAKRLELPKKMLVLGVENKLRLLDVSQGALSYSNQARSLASKYTLQLRASEALVQIAWQTLVPSDAEVESFHAGRPGADTARPCAAAILTTERALIVDDKLRVVTAAAFPSDAGVPTSCLWLGPALLVSTSANQVLHLQWDGVLKHLASLFSGPPVALLGALADRLVLAARGDGVGLMAGRTEVATRGFAVLPPMLVGWSGLAARGILPGGRDRARRDMRVLLASYDATQVPVAVLDSMAASGFADVAASAAARSELPSVTAERKATFAAAAGDWDPLVNLVTAELEESPAYPSPPPKGSSLYTKVVAVARVCELHGRFTQARTLFEAAGAYNELLALCVFQADFARLQSYARSAGRDIEGLADQLLAVNENSFRRMGGGGSGRAKYGGRPNTDDWRVETGVADAPLEGSLTGEGGLGAKKRRGGADSNDGEMSEGSPRGNVDYGSDHHNDNSSSVDLMDMELDIAPAGRLPFMEASLRVTTAAVSSGALPLTKPEGGEDADDDAGQPIAQLDLNSFEAYLGVAGASVLSNAAALPTTAALPLQSLGRADTEASTDLAAAAALVGGMGAGSETTSEADTEAIAAGARASGRQQQQQQPTTDAQAAARAAFQKDQSTAQDEDDFFSSDEESNPADAEARSAASFATTTSNRFMFNIRSPDETPSAGGGAAGGGGTVGGTAGGGAALRAAVMNLKIGGSISGIPASPTASTSGGGEGKKTAQSSEHEHGGGLSTQSSIASMEMYPSLMSLPTIPTPPPAAPLAPGEQSSAMPSSDDPFAAFTAASNQPVPLPGSSSAGALGAGAGAGATTTPTPAPMPAPSMDPFAGISGLPPTLAQAAAGAQPKQMPAAPAGVTLGASEPLPMEPFQNEGAPMRQQAPAPLPQSDLLAGWDEFESIFGGGGAATATPAVAVSSSPAPVISIPAPPSTTAAAAFASPVATLLSPPPPTTAEPSQAAPPDAATIASAEPPTAVRKVHKKAGEAFRRGHWAKATELFGETLNSTPSSPDAANFKQRCVYEYAASLLTTRAAAAPPPAASLLSRHAVSLPISQDQLAVVTAFAVEANMAAGNFGWAGDQLSWLVVQSAEGQVSGPGLDPKILQDRLGACDRAGGSNAALTRDEDVESFALIVGTCEGKADVDDLVGNLVRG